MATNRSNATVLVVGFKFHETNKSREMAQTTHACMHAWAKTVCIVERYNFLDGPRCSPSIVTRGTSLRDEYPFFTPQLVLQDGIQIGCVSKVYKEFFVI